MKAVDLFAGWGGFTLAAGLAGVRVVWAANHWPTAVAVHERNHPDVQHACQDLRQADWSALPRYDLLLASPACQGHSQAGQVNRGRYGAHVTRKHDTDRATAWAVVDCAEVTRPRAIVVENIPDFARWPLFDVWRLALERLGYHVQSHALTASRFGVPQRRERLFVVATRRPVELRLIPDLVEPAFGGCIEWSAGRWRSVTGASPGARRRIERGRTRLGGSFLSQHVTGHPGVALSEPIRTITTKDQWIVVRGDAYRPLTEREYARAQSFPDTFTWPAMPRADVVRGIGNAVPPALGRAVVAAVLEAA